MKFTAPNPLNGETLIKELTSIGIMVEIVSINGDGELELNIKEKDKAKVEEVLANHDGKDTVDALVFARQSALNKLIDLGLTEDEAKAFLG